jgi:polyisoprenoid-binding protein YceI
MRALALSRSLAFTLALAFTAGARSEPARYELDPEHLTIAFLVEHIGYAKMLGAFRRASGGFTFDDTGAAVSDVRVVVATASVDTAHQARDEHVRSDDFLATEEHPEMIFTASGAERAADGTFVVNGELTLLGTTRPLRLEATLNKAAPYPIGDRADVLGISARGTLRRSEFGMSYGVEGALVGDEVELIIELEARRAAGSAQR